MLVVVYVQEAVAMRARTSRQRKCSPSRAVMMAEYLALHKLWTQNGCDAASKSRMDELADKLREKIQVVAERMAEY